MRGGGPLERLFNPRVVAVVGASDDPTKYGSQALENLLGSGYDGTVYSVDPKGRDFGDRVVTVASARDVSEPIDVAFLAIPATACADVMAGFSGNCSFAIVAVSGFEGDQSADLRADLIGAAGSTRIIGPNCNGIYGGASSVSIGYNHGHGIAWTPGDVAVVSQSGAIFSDIGSLLQESGLGINQFVSAGDEIDLTFCDYFENALRSDSVRAVLCVLDGIQEPQRFADCLNQAQQLGIDVTVVKFGNAIGSSALTQAHVGRMAGSSAATRSMCAAFGAAYTTALREGILALRLQRSGAGQVDHVHAASTSGAGAMMVKDAAERQDIVMAPLAPTVIDALGSGQFSQHLNPYDLGAHGVAQAQMAFDALSMAPGPIVLHLTPPPTVGWRTAQGRGLDSLFERVAARTYLVSLSTNRELEDYAGKHGVPVLASIDEFFAAARAVQGPEPGAGRVGSGATDRPTATVVLDEEASRKYLIGLNIPVSPGRRLDRGVSPGEDIDYPVAVKGLVPGVAHKFDKGLVALGVSDRLALQGVMTEMEDREPTLNGVLLMPMVNSGPEIILGWRREEGASDGVIVGGSGGLRAEQANDLFTVEPGVFRDHTLAFWRTLRIWNEFPERLRESILSFSQMFVKRITTIDPEVVSIEMNPVRFVRAGTKYVASPLDALVEMRSHD